MLWPAPAARRARTLAGVPYSHPLPVLPFIARGTAAVMAAGLLESGDFPSAVVSLGVGGAIAWGIFLLYRRDMGQRLEEWKGQTERLLRVVENNTAAITLLNVRLEAAEGRAIDRADRAAERDRRAHPGKP